MVWIDVDTCSGCGTCADVCPEGFEIIDGKSDIENPNAPCIGEAISACPVGAIHSDGESNSRTQNQPVMTSRGMGVGGRKGRGMGGGARARGGRGGKRGGRGRGRR